MKLNDYQRKIVETLDKPLFVAAGAGSGKTATLTERVVYALTPGSGKDGEPYLKSLDEVLIITYTEAAATEIKERIRARLKNAGLTQHVLEVDNAWISTIHGMCNRIISQHAFDLGIDPSFSVASEAMQDMLKKLQINCTLKEKQNQSEFEELTKLYPEAVKTSKTKAQDTSVSSLIENIAKIAAGKKSGFDDLVQRGFARDPFDLVSDMKSYLDCLLPVSEKLKPKKDCISFESASKKIEELLVATKPPAQDKDDLYEKIIAFCKETPPRFRKGKGYSEEVQDLENCIERVMLEAHLAKNEWVGSLFMELAREINEAYKIDKNRKSLLDLTDLIQNAFVLLSDPLIAKEYKNKFKLVMVDEFQDTNDAQVTMIKNLSGKNAEHLCTVGDAQQSIYLFQGADVSVFNKRRDELSEENIVKLTENYRSHNDILRFVAHVCGDKSMIDGFLDLEASRNETGETEKKFSELLEGNRLYVECSLGKTENARKLLAAQIADRFAELHQKGVAQKDMALLLGKTKDSQVYIDALRARRLDCVLKSGSIFKDQTEVKLTMALMYALVNPYESERGLYPVLASEIFNLSNTDMLMLSTGYDEAKQRARKRPISEGFLAMKFVPEYTPSTNLLRAHSCMKKGWKTLKTAGLVEALKTVIYESGWLARLEQLGTEGMCATANIFAMLAHVQELQQNDKIEGTNLVTNYEACLSASSEAPHTLMSENGSNAVQIMTIHGSKGLQFRVVAVAECLSDPREETELVSINEGDRTLLSFASKAKVGKDVKEAHDSEIDEALSQDDVDYGDLSLGTLHVLAQKNMVDAQTEEKKRLLYVGLTRAQECLILGISGSLKKDGLFSRAQFKNTVAQTLWGEGLCALQGKNGESVRSLGLGVSLVERVCTVDETEEGTGVLPTNSEFDQVTDELFSTDSNVTEVRSILDVVLKPKEELSVQRVQGRRGVFSYSSMKKNKEQKEHVRFMPNLKELEMEWDTPELVRIDNIEDAQSGQATNLGSAFHELAQVMVQSGRELTEQAITSCAHKWNCTQNQTERLLKALEVWVQSTTRKQSLEFLHQVPEAPFFVKVTAESDLFAEGAIDLLCYNDKSCAWVVDYKTGDTHLSVEEIRELHKEQAEFYAKILLDQGFTTVTCNFVCVEVLVQNEPLVCTYEFSRTEEE